MKANLFYLYGLTLLSLTGCEAVNAVGNSIETTFKSIKMPDLSVDKEALSAPAADGSLIAGQGKCPTVKGMADLISLSQFSDPALPTPYKLVSVTKLDKMTATCNVATNSVTVELALDFSGTLGPIGVKDMNGQANYTYPYFLSVVSPDGKIMSKDVFALSMVYENGQINYHRQDTLRQVIPLLSEQDANQFQIIVGFQLSESELAYNRAQK
jgi:hypothetical protein